MRDVQEIGPRQEGEGQEGDLPYREAEAEEVGRRVRGQGGGRWWEESVGCCEEEEEDYVVFEGWGLVFVGWVRWWLV